MTTDDGSKNSCIGVALGLGAVYVAHLDGGRPAIENAKHGRQCAKATGSRRVTWKPSTVDGRAAVWRGVTWGTGGLRVKIIVAAKAMLFALALVLGLPTAAQVERLNGDQLAFRLLHPDCLFPDLRYNPDFRICNRHLVDGDRETRVYTPRFSSLVDTIAVKLGAFDGVPYAVFGDQARAAPLYETWLQFRTYPTSTVGTPNGIPGAIESAQRTRYAAFVDVVFIVLVPPELSQHGRQFVGGYTRDRHWIRYSPPNIEPWWNDPDGTGVSCVNDPACSAEHPWYYNQWRTLTAEQVSRMATVIKIRMVNDQCDIGPTAMGTDGSDRIVLVMREDGRISGRCEPIGDSAASLAPPIELAPLSELQRSEN